MDREINQPNQSTTQSCVQLINQVLFVCACTNNRFISSNFKANMSCEHNRCIAIQLFGIDSKRCNSERTNLSKDDEDEYLSQFCSNHYYFTRPFYKSYKCATDSALTIYGSIDTLADKSTMKARLYSAYAKLSIAIRKRKAFMHRFISAECHDSGHLDCIARLDKAKQECDTLLFETHRQEIQGATQIDLIKPLNQLTLSIVEEEDDDVKSQADPMDTQQSKKNAKKSQARKRNRHKLALQKILDAYVVEVEQECADIRKLLTNSFASLTRVCEQLLHEHVLSFVVSSFRKKDLKVYVSQWKDIHVVKRDCDESDVLCRVITEDVRDSFVSTVLPPFNLDNTHLFISEQCIHIIAEMCGLSEYAMFYSRLDTLDTQVKESTEISPKFKRFLLEIFEACKSIKRQMSNTVGYSKMHMSGDEFLRDFRRGDDAKPITKKMFQMFEIVRILQAEFIPAVAHAFTDFNVSVKEARWFHDHVLGEESLNQVWLTESWQNRPDKRDAIHMLCSNMVNNFYTQLERFDETWSKLVSSSKQYFSQQHSAIGLHLLKDGVVWIGVGTDRFVPIHFLDIDLLKAKPLHFNGCLDSLHDKFSNPKTHHAFLPCFTGLKYFLEDVEKIVSK